jgi:hypothetical protein
VKFSYDPDLAAGDRILSAGVFDEDDNLIAELVRDGEIVGDAGEEFRIVTLGFWLRLASTMTVTSSAVAMAILSLTWMIRRSRRG